MIMVSLQFALQSRATFSSDNQCAVVACDVGSVFEIRQTGFLFFIIIYFTHLVLTNIREK